MAVITGRYNQSLKMESAQLTDLLALFTDDCERTKNKLKERMQNKRLLIAQMKRLNDKMHKVAQKLVVKKVLFEPSIAVAPTEAGAEPVTNAVAAEPVTNAVAAEQVTNAVAATEPTNTAAFKPLTNAVAFKPLTNAAAFKPLTNAAAFKPLTNAAAFKPLTNAAAFKPASIFGTLQPPPIFGAFKPVNVTWNLFNPQTVTDADPAVNSAVVGLAAVDKTAVTAVEPAGGIVVAEAAEMPAAAELPQKKRKYNKRTYSEFDFLDALKTLGAGSYFSLHAIYRFKPDLKKIYNEQHGHQMFSLCMKGWVERAPGLIRRSYKYKITEKGLAMLNLRKEFC